MSQPWHMSIFGLPLVLASGSFPFETQRLQGEAAVSTGGPGAAQRCGDGHVEAMPWTIPLVITIDNHREA